MVDEVRESDIVELFQFFSKNVYSSPRETQFAEQTLGRCIQMLERDYKYKIVTNPNGELSANYPSRLPVLLCKKEEEPDESMNLSTERLKELFTRARLARVRSRFPFPVIIVNGKTVCRSATISGGPEIYGRFGYDFLHGTNSILQDDEVIEQIPVPQKEGEWALFDKVRSLDIKLLRTLNVHTIVDLMVEKKKVKYGINMTSSEKVDKERRYSEFRIISLPYPGCEFFKSFRDTGYCAEGLMFDWSRGYIDAQLDVPDDVVSSKMGIDWKRYKSWDLIVITKNYFKVLLKYLQCCPSGMLIHCISGWDRTPLYVSLLRLSLWADGLIHTSMDAMQILYFTVAYDWFSFGHDLPDRLSKGEEIFFFCFYFLKYITSKEFRFTEPSCSSASGGVRHNDSDPVLLDTGGVLLESAGSSTSLNSSCSSVSSRSQDNPPTYFTIDHEEVNPYHPAWPSENSNHGCYSNGTNANHSPYLQSQPSPIPAPRPVRSRHDSCNSSGSWQVVTATGSLRGSSSMSTHCSSQQSLNGASSAEECTDSSVMTVLENPVSSTTSTKLRKERLQAVRTLFYNCYSQAIGYHFTNSSEAAGITGFFGEVAQKIGIRSTQRTLSSYAQ